MRRNAIFWAALATLFVAVPVLADSAPGAPQDQYGLFVQDSPSVKDVKTSLEWDRTSKTVPSNDGGNIFCQSRLENLGRLPTVKELLTILDEQPHQEYEFGALVTKMIDQLAFPDTLVGQPYFTSTPAGPGQFWAVDFSTGKTVPLAAGALGNVRCVK